MFSEREHKLFYFIGNFSEIPYEIKKLREDAHAAVRKLSPNGDQRRRAKSARLPSGRRGWGSRSPLADFVLFISLVDLEDA